MFFEQANYDRRQLSLVKVFWLLDSSAKSRFRFRGTTQHAEEYHGTTWHALDHGTTQHAQDVDGHILSALSPNFLALAL